MKSSIHTTDIRKFQRLWIKLGGSICAVRRTGEMRYAHKQFTNTVRANDRRNDVPAVLLSRVNQLIRSMGADDPIRELGK